jgi:ABC-type sugar transport system ATPase subunit
MFPPREAKLGELLLSVQGVCRSGEFKDVSFDLHAGEIVGFAGLIGAGRTELARAIFGAASFDSGRVVLSGKQQKPFNHPRKALDCGVAYLSEDRKREGLILQQSIRENMALSILRKISRFLFVDRARERTLVQSYVASFSIKMTSMEQLAESLSGGNQQKVVISKLLATESKVFIFDEPTRGIDVGAKYEIYKIMGELTNQGRGIIFISSELPEVLGISDRVMCMCEGRIAGEFSRMDATPEAVMRVLTGGEAA